MQNAILELLKSNFVEEPSHHKESPPGSQISIISCKCMISKVEKTSTKMYRFRQILPQLHLSPIRKIAYIHRLLGFHELLEAEKQIQVTKELLDNYKAINAALAGLCGLALKQTIAGRQYVLMTDASFRASGNTLMIEEDNEKKLNSKRKFWHQSLSDHSITLSWGTVIYFGNNTTDARNERQ